MSEQVGNRLIESGVLGTLLVGAAVALVFVLRLLLAERAKYATDLKAVYDARIADQREFQQKLSAESAAHQSQLLDLTRTTVTAMTATTNASAGVKEAVESLEESNKDTSSLVREQLEKFRDHIETLIRNQSRR